MSGTRAGGIKAAQTNKEKYGNDFYANIGAIGGKISTTGGFAANPELAKKVGAIGGKKSKRGPAEAYKEYSNIEMEKCLKRSVRYYEKQARISYEEANSDNATEEQMIRCAYYHDHLVAAKKNLEDFKNYIANYKEAENEII